MNRFILTNARIVTPTQDFTGSLVIEDGIIADIQPDSSYAEGIDLHGQWLVPGCIDIHSDYLEKELHPRPSADFPMPFAFHFMDQRAAACGLTTLFSAISFSDNQMVNRSYESALERAHALDTLQDTGMIRHFIHARLDPNAERVVDYLDAMKAIPSLRLVVINESIPGQRQFRLADLIVKRAKSQQISIEESERMLRAQIAERSRVDKRAEIQTALAEVLPLGSHDDTTETHVAEAKQFGATLSEMPTTLAAAQKAKELGLWVCMGAPNYVRGGSHCGNLSCHEAMAEGLVDMLCSDYHFPTMLASVIRMMQEGVSPSQAVNYITKNPAEFLGMQQTGVIAVGKQADLVAFWEDQQVAKVSRVWVDGKLKFQTDPSGINEAFGKISSADSLPQEH
ncbi:MAG: alpha-D-ribose 1-methylphosphonate 5-triphosphate diphosphatase [Bacteroidota bacterium]